MIPTTLTIVFTIILVSRKGIVWRKNGKSACVTTKAFNGVSPPLCGRKEVASSNLPVSVAQSDDRLTKHQLMRMNEYLGMD